MSLQALQNLRDNNAATQRRLAAVEDELRELRRTLAEFMAQRTARPVLTAKQQEQKIA